MVLVDARVSATERFEAQWGDVAPVVPDSAGVRSSNWYHRLTRLRLHARWRGV